MHPEKRKKNKKNKKEISSDNKLKQTNIARLYCNNNNNNN